MGNRNYKGKRTLTIRQRLNNYVYHEFGIEAHDMDIKFKFRGHKYRIPQFCWLWMILEAMGITVAAVACYAIIVMMIIVGG